MLPSISLQSSAEMKAESPLCTHYAGDARQHPPSGLRYIDMNRPQRPMKSLCIESIDKWDFPCMAHFKTKNQLLRRGSQDIWANFLCCMYVILPTITFPRKNIWIETETWLGNKSFNKTRNFSLPFTFQPLYWSKNGSLRISCRFLPQQPMGFYIQAIPCCYVYLLQSHCATANSVMHQNLCFYFLRFWVSNWSGNGQKIWQVMAMYAFGFLCRGNVPIWHIVTGKKKL